MDKYVNLTSLTFEGDYAELDKTIDDVQTALDQYSQSVGYFVNK